MSCLFCSNTVIDGRPACGRLTCMILAGMQELVEPHHDPYTESSNPYTSVMDGCVGSALSTEDPEGTFMTE